MKTYMHPDSGIERLDRRSCDRDENEDPRISHVFEGLDNLERSAKENSDLYTVGYIKAMRQELGGLINTLLGKTTATKG